MDTFIEAFDSGVADTYFLVPTVTELFDERFVKRCCIVVGGELLALSVMV